MYFFPKHFLCQTNLKPMMNVKSAWPYVTNSSYLTQRKHIAQQKWKPEQSSPNKQAAYAI